MSAPRPPTPQGETPRIRWEPNGDILMGYVGARPGIAFRIYAPDHRNCQWLLSVRLLADAKFIYADDPDELKAEAERWLEEFVSSLGAVFPAEPPMVCTACRKPVRKVPGIWAPSVWDHAEPEDGRACPDLGAHLTGKPIMSMAAPGPETTPGA